MGFVNFIKTALTAVARAATDDDKLYFPTDGTGIWLNGREYGRTCYYGTCATAAATAAKVVVCGDYKQLVVGSIIGVRFTYTNTASGVTLNVNGTGAKQVRYNTGVNTGNSNMLFGYANRTVFYMWDGTYWVWISYGVDSGNTYPSAHCTTAAATAAKAASCSNYVLLAKSYVHVLIGTANTSKTALTLNINGRGAKAIWINGVASSTTNYTLPAGTYLVYYDGTAYHFRTDGLIPGLGTASLLGEGEVKWPNLMASPVPIPRKFMEGGYGMYEVASYVMTRTVSGTSYWSLIDVGGDMLPLSAWAVKDGGWVKPVGLKRLQYNSKYYWMFPKADVDSEPDIVVVRYVDLDGEQLVDVLP